jgi:hypothetical protein
MLEVSSVLLGANQSTLTTAVKSLPEEDSTDVMADLVGRMETVVKAMQQAGTPTGRQALDFVIGNDADNGGGYGDRFARNPKPHRADESTVNDNGTRLFDMAGQLIALYNQVRAIAQGMQASSMSNSYPNGNSTMKQYVSDSVSESAITAGTALAVATKMKNATARKSRK